MEQPTAGGMGNKFLSSIACLFSYSRYTKIYANCNNAEMADGYCFALRLICVHVCVCEKVYNGINEQ